SVRSPTGDEEEGAMSRADRLFDSFDFDGSSETPELLGRLRGWAMGLGILLMIVGLFATLNAFYATIVTIFMIAAMLIIGGIVQGVQAFVSRRGKSFAIHMLMAILYLVVGFLMFNRPVASALGITLLMAA